MLELAPGPGSQQPTPAPSASNPATPNQQALGVPRNLQIAARSLDTLTLLWDFAEVPVAHAYRVYLNGILIGNPLTRNYFTFGNLQAETSYTLGVETVLNGQTSPRVEIQASTTAGGKEATGNFAGGGSASAASPQTAPVLSGLSPGIGSIGALLTLTGSGFSNTAATNTVRFGDTLATVVSASATELQVKVPDLPNGLQQVSVSLGNQSSTPLAFKLVSDFVANLPSGNNFRDFDIASDSKGNSVVVWTTYPEQGYSAIQAQRYDIFGHPLGSAFDVSPVNAVNQNTPSVAMDNAGDFVVTWQSNENSNQHILSRRFDAAAVPQGTDPVQVDTSSGTSENSEPAVAMDSQGNFVIAWTKGSSDKDVYTRRYLANGQAVNNSEFLIHAASSANQSAPAVAMDSDGDFIVAWQENGAVSKYDTYSKRYDKVSDTFAAQAKLNTETSNRPPNPSVAMDPAGNAVITWSTQASGPNPLSRIIAQRYQVTGETAGTIFEVNTFTSGSTYLPDVAMDALGGFMISWTSELQDGDHGEIYAQRYLKTGDPSGSEQRLNTITAGNQTNAAITSLYPGYYAGTWQTGITD